jgi:hypothetical protein
MEKGTKVDSHNDHGAPRMDIQVIRRNQNNIEKSGKYEYISNNHEVK